MCARPHCYKTKCDSGRKAIRCTDCLFLVKHYSKTAGGYYDVRSLKVLLRSKARFHCRETVSEIGADGKINYGLGLTLYVPGEVYTAKVAED